MTEKSNKRLPAGIPSFVEIRRRGYPYVDKTYIVRQLLNGVKFNHLSRPCRFGKSVLTDTLQAYFDGRRDLLEGLKTMQVEEEWVARPALRLDMSRGGAEFTQISIFSGLNNLPNISSKPKFATICEISRQEIENNFMPTRPKT